MKRIPLLLRFALAVPIVCLLSTGFLAQSSSPQNGSNSAATTQSAKQKKSTTQAKAASKSTTRGTSSGATRATQGAAVLPAPPNPADEAKSVRGVLSEKVGPIGEFNGDVRDLPQIPSQPHPELDLVEPADYVHNDLPLKTPIALAPAALGPMPALTANFSGMSYLDNYCVGGQCGNGHPPDTNGDVGINYYIEGINEAYAIYDKATGNRVAAFTEVSLWANAGTTPCTTDPFGDPIVVYDQTANRWILTNLGFNLSGGNPVAPYMQCFAVSKSGDPVNGGWWLYAIRIDQSPVPTNTLNDYPKFGVWGDGCLYMGADGFLNAGSYNAAVSGGGTTGTNTYQDVTNINPQQNVCGTVQLTTTASLVKLGNGSYQATVLVVNNGTGTAQNVKLTAATLGAASGSPIPQTIGSLVPGGGFAFTTVTYPSSAGNSGTGVLEKYSGTYAACPTSGTFGASIRATLP